MNKLNHLLDFQNILADYKLSSSSENILHNLEFCLLLGPSAAGKNTIIKKLLETNNYYFIVSDTTRKKRVNNGLLETNGIEYWFRKEEDFLLDLKNGKFLEAEIIHDQQVSGISIRELNKAKKLNKIAIADIDIGGVENIVRINPDLKVVVVVPPSFSVWLERLFGRDNIIDQEVFRRMKTALKIYERILSSDDFLVVVNDKIDEAAESVNNFCKFKDQPHANNYYQALIKELIEKTRAYLLKVGSLDS